MDNYGIMITMQKTDIQGNGYTEVHVMDFKRERIWKINFNNLDKETIPDTLREYVRENGEKIKAGRWHYSGSNKK
ncbi:MULTISPECIES: hypothetical protein [Metabacillus]|uniref:Uncharacterized protein n=2 Tax=Metabacillus TaxID=2675233 RepID=A0A179SS89_9BACI|nr:MULTISPECIES: hypothetical protein [Metabacillus]OAS84168.1 hypothetical protein A6K24_25705 [Metabacillus litoralis]QNF29906.1 hypothetical protein HUW50_21905 [Metabacillus sp. KUDC1714]